MSKTEYVTVVYEVNDWAAFDANWKSIFSLLTMEKGRPFRVTGVAHENLQRRLSLIEDRVNGDDDPYDTVEIIQKMFRTGDLDQFAQHEGAAP